MARQRLQVVAEFSMREPTGTVRLIESGEYVNRLLEILREKLRTPSGNPASTIAPTPLARPAATIEKAPKLAISDDLRMKGSGDAGFLATAGDQLRGSGESAMDRVRLKLRNILTPSQPVTEPQAFAGRRHVFTQLINALEDQRLHVVIYGSRGMGKTSLLHILSGRAREARYQVVYGSCGVGTSFSDLFRSLCNEIPLRYHNSFRSIGSTVDRGETVARLLPQGDLSARQVGDVLSGLVGTRVLMIVDEFDRSESGDFRERIADLIKNLSDRAARVQLIIAGVGTNLSQLIEHVPSIQRNILGLQIPLMSDDEVHQLLHIAHRQVGLSFSDEAAKLVIAVARGWPYVATLLAHHAALSAVARKSVTVELEDTEEAVRQAAGEVAGRLSRETLREVAFARTRVSEECLELAAKAHIADGGEFTPQELGQECAAAIEALASEDLLVQSKEDRFGKSYEFRDVTVPLHLWLSRAAATLIGASVDSR